MEMSSQQKQASNAGPHLIIYPNRRVMLQRATLAGFIAAFCLLGLIVCFRSGILNPLLAILLVLALVISFLGARQLFAVSLSFEPTLIVTQQGILLKYRQVAFPWSKIEEVSVYSTSTNKFLHILLKKVHPQAGPRRFRVPQIYLDTPPEDLLQELSRTFEQEIKKHNIQIEL